MIGPIIKAARQARGLTLAEVGSALGVTRQYVQAWEAGRRNPGPKHLAKLAEVLGLEIADLLPRIQPDLGANQ
jgi:transcriptional regulator with XRE-family HTH domain